MIVFAGAEHSDEERGRTGYHSGTDDERSNEAFANLRARSRSPVHTTTATTTTTTKLNDEENSTEVEKKRTRYAMSDTDTSGDEDPITDDEVHEVLDRLSRLRPKESRLAFRSKCPFGK